MKCESTNTYRVFAGLPEDTDKGWVYLYLKPPFRFRTTIKIHNTGTNKSVYCEYRSLDNRFIRTYNERPHTAEIRPKDWVDRDRRTFKDAPAAFDDVLVISEWYRSALSIPDANVKWELHANSRQQYEGSLQLGTREGENKYGFSVETTERQCKPKPEVRGEKPQLRVRKPTLALWADLRASCQHPEPVVRLGTRLGILGTWLGLMGLLFSVLPDDACVRASVGLPLGAIFALLGFIAGRGIPRTKATSTFDSDDNE